MHSAGSSLLPGYTGTELQHYFAPYMESLTTEVGMSQNQVSTRIQEWYNGYSWDGENFVYNPFSILNLFTENSFENFWFSTGTPSFLIKLVKSQQSDVMEFERLPVSNYTFDSDDLENIEAAALLFQTGYLTIKRITLEGVEKTYELSYPNKEVRDSFLTHLLGEYTQKKLSSGTRILNRMRKAITSDDIERFIQELQSLFASIPYHIFIGQREAYYHSVIYLVLRLSGATVKCYEAYRGRGKEIILIGIGFEPAKRNLGTFDHVFAGEGSQ